MNLKYVDFHILDLKLLNFVITCKTYLKINVPKDFKAIKRKGRLN